jgi:choline dehydrogenase-like flavoprotein
VWLDLRYRNCGKWTDADTGKQFTPKQHYCVGGNTKVYGAILFRFRERDFGAVQHVDGASPAWPMSYPDFEPYYTRAEHLYHAHGDRGVDPDDPPSDTKYRYPPLSHEPRIAQSRRRRSRRASGARPATGTRAWSTAKRTRTWCA